jgi:hypothetical protein
VGTNTAASSSNTSEPLVPSELSATFQQRWEAIQTQFVDEPRGAVEDADGLVANLMQQLAEGFARERERLEAQWDRGEDISTDYAENRVMPTPRHDDWAPLATASLSSA